MSVTNRQDSPRQQCDDIKVVGNVILPQKVKAETSPDYGGECFTKCKASSPLRTESALKVPENAVSIPVEDDTCLHAAGEPCILFYSKKRVWLKWCERLCAGNLHKDQLHVQLCVVFFLVSHPTQMSLAFFQHPDRNYSAKLAYDFSWGDPKFVFCLTEENKDTFSIWNQI